MPWKRTSPVSERLRFIAALETSDKPFSALCRQFGISRKTGYKWRQRYNDEGPAALEDRSPVAKRIRHKLPPELVTRIINIRKEHPSWGPKKIRVLLAQSQFWRTPAASTIGDVLKKYGLITRCRRRSTRPSANQNDSSICDTDQPNQTWCIDFKGQFSMGSGRLCYPLTLTDHHSRFLIKCEALLRPKESGVRPHMERAFHEFGLPLRIRSDNGAPFATLALGGLSALSVWWLKLGVLPERIAPGHPQQNGRHERMHRTLKADVPRAQELPEQQLAFDRFRHIYNEVRPHEALEMKTPAQIYRASQRILPSRLKPFEYSSDMDCRKVDRHGRIRFRGSSHVKLSPVLSQEWIGLKQFDEERWLIYVGAFRAGCLRARDKNLELVELPRLTGP